jgi:hypothetical protein
MEIIAIIENDNQVKTVCIHPWQISITKLDDYFMAASRCSMTNEPIVCEISKEDAASLIQKGVECFVWRE